MTPLRGFLQFARVLLLCLGGLWLVVTFSPLVPWLGRQLASNWSDADGDVLIVLGGSIVQHSSAPDDSVIGLSSYWRSVYAARAWRQGHFRQLVLSGADTATEMKRFLVAYGVPEASITLEDRSGSTRENALFTADLLRSVGGRKVLLTSDFHMVRAAGAFRNAGVEVITRPIPDVLKRASAWTGRWECFWEEMEEITKLGYYKLHGWLR